MPLPCFFYVLSFFQIRLGVNAVPFEQAAMECCLKHVCKDLLECARNVEPRLRTVGYLGFLLVLVVSRVSWPYSTDVQFAVLHISSLSEAVAVWPALVRCLSTSVCRFVRLVYQ